MVVPYKHVASLTKLSGAQAKEIFEFLAKAEKVMTKAMKPHGFNGGLNLGRAAGAGIDDHIHFHLIPRWFGDTNFWPVVSETKSMPQHLMTTYDLMKKYWR